MAHLSASLHIVLNGCVDPDWRSPSLIKPEDGIVTPLDAIKAKLNLDKAGDLLSGVGKLFGKN